MNVIEEDLKKMLDKMMISYAKKMKEKMNISGGDISPGRSYALEKIKKEYVEHLGIWVLDRLKEEDKITSTTQNILVDLETTEVPGGGSIWKPQLDYEESKIAWVSDEFTVKLYAMPFEDENTEGIELTLTNGLDSKIITRERPAPSSAEKYINAIKEIFDQMETKESELFGLGFVFENE